jgi:hypothetical protein
MGERLAIIPALLLALLAAPLTLISSGLLILLGKVLGDRTDEGLDARGTYHFIAALLGPILIWPVVILGFAITAWMLDHPPLHVLVLILILPFAFHLSNLVMIKAWDLYVTARDARRIGRLRTGFHGDSFCSSVTELLAALK